jgi:hypothetical protein
MLRLPKLRNLIFLKAIGIWTNPRHIIGVPNRRAVIFCSLWRDLQYLRTTSDQHWSPPLAQPCSSPALLRVRCT